MGGEDDDDGDVHCRHAVVGEMVAAMRRSRSSTSIMLSGLINDGDSERRSRQG